MRAYVVQEAAAQEGLRIAYQGATFPHSLPLQGLVKEDEVLQVSKVQPSKRGKETCKAASHVKVRFYFCGS